MSGQLQYLECSPKSVSSIQILQIVLSNGKKEYNHG